MSSPGGSRHPGTRHKHRGHWLRKRRRGNVFRTTCLPMLQRKMDTEGRSLPVHTGIPQDRTGQDRTGFSHPSHPHLHSQPTLCSCRLWRQRRGVLLKPKCLPHSCVKAWPQGWRRCGRGVQLSPSLHQEKAVGQAGLQPGQLQKRAAVRRI